MCLTKPTLSTSPGKHDKEHPHWEEQWWFVTRPPCVISCEPFGRFEGRSKKITVFLGDLSQIWVGGGADSQTFSDIYQPLFSAQKFPNVGGQSKPKKTTKTQEGHKDTEGEGHKTGLRRRRKKQD